MSDKCDQFASVQLICCNYFYKLPVTIKANLDYSMKGNFRIITFVSRTNCIQKQLYSWYDVLSGKSASCKSFIYYNTFFLTSRSLFYMQCNKYYHCSYYELTGVFPWNVSVRGMCISKHQETLISRFMTYPIFDMLNFLTLFSRKQLMFPIHFRFRVSFFR